MSQASEYRDLTVERYLADWKTQRIVERTLQMAIEGCLDLASHVVAARGGLPSVRGRSAALVVAVAVVRNGLRGMEALRALAAPYPEANEVDQDMYA